MGAWLGTEKSLVETSWILDDGEQPSFLPFCMNLQLKRMLAQASSNVSPTGYAQHGIEALAYETLALIH